MYGLIFNFDLTKSFVNYGCSSSLDMFLNGDALNGDLFEPTPVTPLEALLEIITDLL